MIQPAHAINIKQNMLEVESLLSIHKNIAGSGPGYKHNVEILNKSALVMLVACFEAFIEDLAESAFDFMIEHANEPSVFPEKVMVLASQPLKENKDSRRVWELAGDGWKNVISNHKQALLKKHIGTFNTPKPANIDDLFRSLIGITSITQSWHWKGVNSDQAINKLESLVEDRGEIAHRVSSSKKTHKKDVTSAIKLIKAISVLSHNHVNNYLKKRVGIVPWQYYREKSIGRIKGMRQI